MSPSHKRAAASDLQQQFEVSQRRACAVLEQPRSTQRYQTRRKTDEAALCRRLREIVRRRPRFGYRRLTAVLRREGWRVNAKRIQRLCRKEGLKVRRIVRKRRAIGDSAQACHVRRAQRNDHVWTWDFAFDRTESGTTLKWLSIVDEYTRHGSDPLGQRAGVRGRGDPGVAQATADRGVVHRAGESLGERLRGEFSLEAAGRVPRPGGVREPECGTDADGVMEGGLQPSPAAQLAGVRDPVGVRGPLCSLRSGYALTPAAQRSYPTHTLITPGTESGVRSCP